MVLGCGFLMLLGFEIFWEEFIGHWGETDRQPEPGFMVFNRRALIFYVTFMTSGTLVCSSIIYKNLCHASGTFVALGGLTLWHARLIHAGQTSIEVCPQPFFKIGDNFLDGFCSGSYKSIGDETASRTGESL